MGHSDRFPPVIFFLIKYFTLTTIVPELCVPRAQVRKGLQWRIYGPKFSQFHAVFLENLAISYVGAPPRTVGAPSYGECLLRRADILEEENGIVLKIVGCFHCLIFIFNLNLSISQPSSVLN